MTGTGRDTGAGTGSVALVAWSLYLPGVDLPRALPELAAAQPDRAAQPVYPPDQASRVLGRKGLLNRDPATRLALCAVHRALGRPDGTGRVDGPPDPRVAVVASSNLGNLAGVAEMVRTLRTEGLAGISPLTVANASSNIIASAVAIWFRFGGPNLMLCSGATSGLDALAAGSLLLRTGRADRVVVVGVEPADEVTARLLPAGIGGAACVVLADARDAPNSPVLGLVRAAAGPLAPADSVDLTSRCGDLYGAAGIGQAALATALLTRSAAPPPTGGAPALPAGDATAPPTRGATAPPTRGAATALARGATTLRLAGGDATDGWRTATVSPPPRPESPGEPASAYPATEAGCGSMVPGEPAPPQTYHADVR